MYDLHKEFADNVLPIEWVYFLWFILPSYHCPSILWSLCLMFILFYLSLYGRVLQSIMLKYTYVIFFRDKLDGTLRGTLWLDVQRRSHGNVKYTIVNVSGYELHKGAAKMLIMTACWMLCWCMLLSVQISWFWLDLGEQLQPCIVNNRLCFVVFDKLIINYAICILHYPPSNDWFYSEGIVIIIPVLALPMLFQYVVAIFYYNNNFTITFKLMFASLQLIHKLVTKYFSSPDRDGLLQILLQG